MKEKIIELRKVLPIPMAEALQLLKENDGDVETCIYLFKAKSIKQICDATGCDEQMANFYYEREKFDINRAISFIKDELYDKNYKPIEGVNTETLQDVIAWINVVQSKDLGVSLSYTKLDEVINTLSKIEALKETSSILNDAYRVYQTIFKDYTDDAPLEVFVRLNQQLDTSPEFEEANKSIPLRIIPIKEEVSRHWRNVRPDCI